MSASMPTSLFPPTSELQRVFGETVKALGATSVRTYDDGVTLIARAVLAPSEEVRIGDRLHGGVAIRTSEHEILVHPMTFRLVCTNGAIRAHAEDTRIVSRVSLEETVAAAHSYALDGVITALVDAVRLCASPRALRQGAHEMRSALAMDAETAIERLELLSVVHTLPATPLGQALQRTLGRHLRALGHAANRERSAFAFGNALTAAGRDAPHPELQWTLEEYGAAVFAAADLGQRPPTASHRSCIASIPPDANRFGIDGGPNRV